MFLLSANAAANVYNLFIYPLIPSYFRITINYHFKIMKIKML